MKIELKTVFDELIFEGDFASIAEVVKAAIAEKKSLSFANLSGADLRYVNLRGVDLRGVNLRDANLRFANLSGADLRYVNLRGVDLRGVNLRDANLRFANLSGVDLSDANLRGVDLRFANLRGVKNSSLAIAQTRILPEGNIIVWKKSCCGAVVKLLIPVDAKRSHAFGRKCRAEFARVLAVFRYGIETSTTAKSYYDSGKTIYEIGKEVRCHKWCDDFTEECAGGIHFFITREEAEAYQP